MKIEHAQLKAVVTVLKRPKKAETAVRIWRLTGKFLVFKELEPLRLTAGI